MLLGGRFISRHFVLGSSFLGVVLVAYYFVGVLFLGSRSWVLCLLLVRRFVPGSSYLGVMLVACYTFYSWVLVAVPGVVVPGVAVSGVAVLGVVVLGVLGALDSLGSRRPLRGLRLPRLVGCSRVVARCFKGVSGEGLCG